MTQNDLVEKLLKRLETQIKAYDHIAKLAEQDGNFDLALKATRVATKLILGIEPLRGYLIDEAKLPVPPKPAPVTN